MRTVTAKPSYGTSEYYAALIRPRAVDHLDGLVLALVEDLACDPIHDLLGVDRLANIRNLLSAVARVRAEAATR
jgi:hypothetical protein